MAHDRGDLPERRATVVVATGGPAAARIAEEKGDGLMATEPQKELGSALRAAREHRPAQ